jgi:hypothetical protein
VGPTDRELRHDPRLATWSLCVHTIQLQSEMRGVKYVPLASFVSPATCVPKGYFRKEVSHTCSRLWAILEESFYTTYQIHYADYVYLAHTGHIDALRRENDPARCFQGCHGWPMQRSEADDVGVFTVFSQGII